MNTCPVCGRNVPRGADVCDNCGAILNTVTAGVPQQRASRAANVGNGSRAAVATKPRTCPNCKSTAVDADGICANCGYMLPENGNGASSLAATVPMAAGAGGAPLAPTAPATLHTCPRCGNELNGTEKFCRKCGYNVASARLGTSKAVAPAAPSKESRLSIGVGSSVGPGGRYKIAKKIGSGGMGAVFLAHDISLDNREVVIKALLTSDDPDAAAALISERKFLSQLKHANIVGILDFFSIGIEGYIVMEYVAGRTLYQIMEENGGPLPAADAIRYILGILPAFAYLHRLDLVYCDFKPQNVMLERLKDGSEIVKLIDLGTVIKHEKNPEAVYGTEGFYAPEAVKAPAPETDLYTICRSLAWMVSWMDLMRPQFGLPQSEYYKAFREYPALYGFLQKGTSPVPTKRFQSAEMMEDQLRGVLRVVAGGDPDQPVTSKLFATGALSTTGKLGMKGMAALDERDPAIDLLKQGDLVLRGGNNTAALNVYKDVVRHHPGSVDGRLRLAEVSLERGDYAEALAQITQVQRLDPSNWKIAWYTGRLLEAQGNLPAALDQYRELVQDLPGELPPLLSLGRVYGKLDNDRLCVETYQTVIKADPSNTEALFGAAEAHRKMQQHDDAAQVLMAVRPTSSKYTDAQMQICRLYLRDKTPASQDMPAVSNALRNLATAGADTPDYLLHRADFYRTAAELAEVHTLPPNFALPEDSLDDGPNTQRATPSVKRLRTKAAEAYAVYLQRIPRTAPEREAIVRRRAKTAPWRVF